MGEKEKFYGKERFEENNMLTFSEHCSVEGCDRIRFAKGFCQLHYQRQFRKGTTNATNTENKGWECKEYGCKKEAAVKGLCREHYYIHYIKKKGS